MEQIGINLVIAAKDPTTMEICKRYWAQKEDGAFSIGAKQLAAELGVEMNKLTRLIKDNSTVLHKTGECATCHESMYVAVHSRSDLQSRHHIWPGKQCQHCEEEAERERQEQVRREEIEIPYRLHQAFERGVWQGLKPLDFNLLIAIVKTSSLREAFRSVGLSDSRGDAAFSRLVKMDLIGIWDNGTKFCLDPDLREMLVNYQVQRQVKSIFGSPKALDLFRQLKRQHAFVFPEVPVCAFVERSDVKHLFTEAWHNNYFLTCRVDFVICDSDGKPTQAFEYQGSYHYNPEQRNKDYFKRRVLEEVGVTVSEINGDVDKQFGEGGEEHPE